MELDNNTPESGSCVTIPLIDDNRLEEMEEFTLSLFSRIGDTRIDDVLNGTDVTIVDDDGTYMYHSNKKTGSFANSTFLLT